MSSPLVVRETGRLVALEFRQGIDFKRTFRLRDKNGPLNLTGYSFAAQVRKDPLSSVAAEFAFAFQVDAPNGEVVMLADVSKTGALVAGKAIGVPESTYWWDCVMTDSAGGVRPLFHGPVSVLRRVTRS